MNDFDRSRPASTRAVVHKNEPAEPTPEQRSDDALARATRAMDSGDHWLGEVRRARDPRLWEARRKKTNELIEEVRKALDDAKEHGADPAERTVLVNRLTELERAVAQAQRPPIPKLSLETQIDEALAARPAGSLRDGHDGKEASLRDLFVQLRADEGRTLLWRIGAKLPEDTLVAAFLALDKSRRERLCATLADGPRHEDFALESARRSQPHGLPAGLASEPEATHDPGATPGLRSTIHATAPIETIDVTLRRILEAGESDEWVESQLALCFAELDARTRSELAERFARHRPGFGDDVATRFVRLESSVRRRLVAALTSSAPIPAAPAEPPDSLASAVDASAQGEPKRETAPAMHDAAATSPRPTSDGKPLEPLNAERYWAKYGAQTMQRALDRAMAELVFEITGPGLAFPTSECGAFLMSSLGWRMLDTAPHHVSQLLDTPIYELIDGVRVLDDQGRGPDAFEPAVVSRIVERLGLGIRHAVARLALPYAKARSRAASAAKAAGGDPISRGLGPLQAPQGAPAPALPDPDTLGARTTIEHAVAESMCAGFVEFHPDKFPLVYDTTIPGAPQPAKLELERGRGDWLTVRVVEPASASAVDVANALYGTPELAHLVVGAGNRFSYVFPPGGQLAEPYETEFRNHMAGDGASPLDELSARNTRDPVLGFDEERADQRALTSAKASGAVATGAGAAPALQRLEILQSVIDSIASAAAPLGVAPIIGPLQARVRQRRTACAADPAEATKWAAHASEQLTLVSDAKAGFDAITEQMFAIGLPAASTADGPELVGDVTASMQGPTRELAAAFAAAVAASEQLDIGRERLATAKERLAAYPFDMADRMLAVIRKRIASTGHHATMPMNSYETVRMAALEAELGRTIGELRIAVVNGDGTAALKLTALRSQLSMLDLQSTIGSTLTAINELSGELPRVESMDPDKAREAWIHDQLHAAMGEWMQFAANYDAFYQAGHARDPATLEMIRARLQALRSKTNLPALVHELAMYAEDEGKRQRWINIGIMIGAALLAAASGGIASGAIGGVAGSIVGAGIESLTFTAITSTLNQDPSFGGFMAELALNFATFGGLRAVSGGAKFLAGGKLTLSQKLIEMTVEGLWMVASAKAQEKIAEAFAHGGKVTPQRAASIFGQQMAISFASRVLVRVGGVFVQGVVGVEKLHEVQLALAKRAEEEQQARLVLASGDGKLGEQLVKVDTDVLKAEQHALERVHEVASNPAEAATHGITAEPGALERVAADAQGAAREVRAREMAALMAHAEVKADHAIVEPPVYAELLAKHRAQGSTIVEGFDSAGQPHAKITPSLSDGSFGKPFTLHQRLGDEVEKILAAKNLPNTAVIGDYLAKRANDRAGALSDLRKVNTPAELDQLMSRTLGEEAAATREHVAKPPGKGPPLDAEARSKQAKELVDKLLERGVDQATIEQLTAKLDDEALRQLLGHSLSPSQIGRLSKMTEPQLKVLWNLGGETLKRIVGTLDHELDVLASLGPEALKKLAPLHALQLKNLASLAPAELTALARLDLPRIEKLSTLEHGELVKAQPFNEAAVDAKLRDLASTEAHVGNELRDPHTHHHLRETNFLDRGGLHNPGHAVRVSVGGKPVAIEAPQYVRLEPTPAAATAPPTTIQRIEATAPRQDNPSIVVTGEVLPNPTTTGMDAPVPGSPYPKVTVETSIGSHAYTDVEKPPPGTRVAIKPKDLASSGFAGGHTRTAWNVAEKTYGDVVIKTGEQGIQFKLPGKPGTLDAAAIRAEVTVKPGTKKPFKDPKTIFERDADLDAFEAYARPYLAAKAEALRSSPPPNNTVVTVDVPVTTTGGADVVMKVEMPWSVYPVGHPSAGQVDIATWWLGQSNFVKGSAFNP